MRTFNAEHWHQSVKRVYEEDPGYRRYAAADSRYAGRLIPLCTPVPEEVDVLVIGTCHSDFDPADPLRSAEIADSYSRSVSSVSSYLVHDHNFIRGMRRVMGRTGLPITERWVGTNRCPIQTGPDGISAIQRESWFTNAQKKMDRLLTELIAGTNPRILILAGNFAAALLYGDGKQMQSLRPKKIGSGHNITAVVPIWHPSRASFDQRTVERLSGVLPRA